MAEFLSAVVAAAGLPIEFQEALPGRCSLIARLTPSGPVRQRVILAPHLDTVGLPGDPRTLFSPVQKNTRLYGRGACDTKGSIAAMVSALLNVAESGRRPAETEVMFVGLVDEENGQSGSRAFAKSGIRADLAIVGEPTCLKVVTAHKGDVWLRIETAGKSAHGARPELGKNAVHAMAKIVDALETDYAKILKRKTHALLGRGTVNVGSIGGGTQPNIVPSHCWITVDRRTLPGETETSVRAEVQALLRGKGLRARLGMARTAPCLPLETDQELPLVQQLFGVARQRIGIGVDYFCDAAVLAQGGTPSVVFGPGDIAQAHTANEWIGLQSLDEATAILERFLRQLP